MSHTTRSNQSPRARNILRSHRRSWFLSALIAGFGFTSNSASTSYLYAQVDVDNSATKNLITNDVESATGAYNNLGNGTLNFNGPNGTAGWSSGTLSINNAGTVNLKGGNLGIIGDVTNTGSFQMVPQGGTVQVGGDFNNSGGNGTVLINGGGIELIEYLGGSANFTNNSTAATGVTIGTNRYLIANTITNSGNATISSSGRIEARTEIINNGTIKSNAVTSALVGTITNNGTIEARGSVAGDVTNLASKSFTVTGNLAFAGNFTNTGTLDVSGGNLTGTNELMNNSTITIANNRTASATVIKNETDGTIALGNNTVLTATVLENNATITVGVGSTVSSTSTTTGEDLTNKASGTITFNGPTGTANLSSGTGTIVNQGTINLNAGTVLVSGNLVDTGTIAIADGATFKTGSANQTIANAITLAGNSTFNTNGFGATASGNITGTGGLTKNGLGNLTLNGTNTFSGATSINAGQLTLIGGSAMNDTTALTIGAAGKLKIEDDETIGSLAGVAGSETNLAGDLTTGGDNSDTTYSGTIIGTGKLTKEGSGTMTLAGSNANTFSGGVDVNTGTLVASTNEQLGTGAVNVGSDGTLDIDTGTTQTVDGVSVASEGTLNNSGTLTSSNRISNSGSIQNLEATSVISGGITNSNADAIIDNKGIIYGGVSNNAGTVHNDTSTSVINGGLSNARSQIVNNTGTINGGVTSSGTLNSNTTTSIITGGLDNRGDANLRNQVSGAIINQAGGGGPRGRSVNSSNGAVIPTITVTGDLVGNSTLLNKDTAKLHVKDGNFTGITTLTNQSTNAAGVQIDATRTLGANAVTNQFGSTIVNSGTLQSATAINNSGTITNDIGATVSGGINNAQINSLVTNNGTINGGITENFGVVNSLDAGSLINGGVNNSGTVNARNQISGAIVNSAEHSFTDVTITHAQANAAGTVAFGSDVSAPTLNLNANSSGSAGGAGGNGDLTIEIVFDATTAGSSYDVNSNTITVSFTGLSATSAQIRDAINDGDAGDIFTASGGNGDDEIDADITSVATLTGGRDSGAALIRVSADATGSAAQNKTVTILNDNSIAVDSAIASIDSTTGSIVVKVRGDVGYSDIAAAIDDLSGFNADITTSVGDQGYQTLLDTPPTESTLANGVFNVEGDLLVDNTFTNGGHLNLNGGNLTGVTTLTNTGNIVVQDDYLLQATTVDNTSGQIDLGYDSTLEAGTLTNSSSINVYGQGDIFADGTITNNATGTINFGLGSTGANEISELYSDSNTIVNNGRIDVTNGILRTTGNVSGNGTIVMGNGTTFQSGNNNQTISNRMTLANAGSATFDTVGKNVTLSGSVSGNGQFAKLGAGSLTLSGNNTFTGPAVINGGQLTLQGGNAIANSTSVQLNSGSLKVSSAETIGSLATSTGTQTILDTTLTTGANNSSTTSSGVISGTAGLVKQGSGTMTLNSSAANTFMGGTTVSGGALTAATNQQLGTGSVSVGTGASLTTGNSTTQTVAGLTNQGTVSLGNSATLNTGSSHLNNSGTINVGTSANIIDTGVITNSGTINFTGGSATLSSGTNSITNTGNINLNAGTVLVKGNLAGNGSINMNNGTTLRSGNANQQIANGIRVNSGTAVIDTNGNNVNLTGTIAGVGTLNKVGIGNLTWGGVNNGNALINSGVMITSTQSQVGNIQITNGSGVVFDQNTNGTYSGNVTGNGTFTKMGSGAVTVTGNSVYSGGTNVMAGSLFVGSHGVGQVQSNVNVGNQGTLGGGGTIVGNVVTQQGARIAAGNSIGTLNVTGNLNASGSVVENELNGTTSDLINVTGSANIAGATLENRFDATASYTTRMYRALNATGGVTGRFASVTNVNAPANFLYSTYYTPTTANVVLTSLADATLASSTSTSLLSTGQDYLTTIMNQVNGYQFGGLGMLAGESQTRARRNVWFKGVGFFNDINASSSSPVYSTNTGGGIVGIDQAVGENTRLGFAGGYTVSDLLMKNTARANADINSARLNLYGAHSFDLVTFSGIGGYTYHDVDSKRNLLGIGTALGKQSQNEASLNFQLTMNPKGEAHSLLPYLGVQWVHLSQNAYSETGTPGFDMVFNKASVDSLRPYVGMGYQHRIVNHSGVTVIPYLFTRYSRETIMDSNLTNLSINGSNFVVAGIQPNQNIVGLGGGINSQFRQNLDWYLSYNVDLGDRSTNQNAAGGLGFKF